MAEEGTTLKGKVAIVTGAGSIGPGVPPERQSRSCWRAGAAYGPSGIRLNCVAPGMINTPLRAGVMAKTGLDLEKMNRQLALRTALQVEGSAWDIAKAVAFLVGPDGSDITGGLLPVDGGVTQLMG